MSIQTKPKISAFLSLSPPIHSYSNSQAPTLSLILISHHPGPVVIYADYTSSPLMLAYGAFNIIYLSTGAEIEQSKRTLCRIPPPSKVAVSLNEEAFHTLYPNAPKILTTPFTRKLNDDGGRPLAKDDPGYSKRGACGVDGLLAGYDYLLRLCDNSRLSWDHIRWWEYGTKEEILAKGLDGRKVKFSPGPHGPITPDKTGIQAIAFRCVE